MQIWSSDGVRQERTGWRCKQISDRHRKWGYNCPAVDMDFMVAEYNYGKPVALVEYKEASAREPSLTHPTYQAISALADGYADGPLPFMVVFYNTRHWCFRVVPVNEKARRYYAHVAGAVITEQRFVRSLYLLRKTVLTKQDEAAIARLNDVLPETEEALDEGSPFP